MKEKKYTELDEFFRSRLKPEELEEQAWNTPSDSVFGAAMEKVNSSGSNKRIGWIWLLAVGATLVLTGVILWYNARIEKMDEQIELLIEAQKPIVSEMEKDNENLTTTESTANQLQETGKNENPVADVAHNKTVPLEYPQNPQKDPFIGDYGKFNYRKDIRGANEARQEGKSIVGGVARSTEGVVIDKGGQIERSSEVDLTSEISPETVVGSSDDGFDGRSDSEAQVDDQPTDRSDQKNLIAANNDKADSSDSNDQDEQVIGTGENEDESESGKSKDLYSLFSHPSIYVYGGKNYTHFTMKSETPLVVDLTGYDHWYSGNRFGIGFRHGVGSRFGVSYNLGYDLIHNESQFQQNETYYKDGETTGPDGNTYYSMGYSFTTPLGTGSENLEFDMGTEGLPDSEPLMQKTFITNEFRVLSFGLSAEYSIVMSGQFWLNATAGISANHVFSASQNAEMQIYHDGSMIGSGKLKGIDPNQYARLYTSGSLGLAAQYHFGRFYVRLNSQYTKGFQSIRAVDETKAVRTHAHGFMMDLQLGFKL